MSKFPPASDGELQRILALAVEHSPASVIITDRDGNIEYVNPRFCALTGYEASEVLGEKPSLLKSGEMPSEEYRRLWAELKAGRQWRGEFHNKKKNGELYWEAASISPIRDARGEISHFVAVKEDITLLKKTLAALKSREEKYRRLVENLSSEFVFYSYGLDGILTYVSPSASDITGYSNEELVAHYSTYLTGDPVNQEVPEKNRRSTQGILQPPYEVELRHKNGSTVRFEVFDNPVRGPSGEVIAVEGIAHDVTERRRIAEALRKSEEKRDQETLRAETLRSLGIFAGGVAHDFNNFLTAILGNLSLLKMGSNSAQDAREMIQEAESAGLRARDLARQLLTFSKGGAPVKRPVSLRAVVGETARLILAGSPHELESWLPADLRAVDADIGQIGQVIGNLVLNAKQAMPGGGKLTLRAENFDLDAAAAAALPPLKPGPHIRLRVEDTGIGIKKENLQKIFSPYFTTKSEGSGLGLSICWSVVERHGGRLEVDSEPGRGSVFTILLPALEAPQPQASPAQDGATRGSGRVLIMDDEASIVSLARRILSGAGYETAGAKDGAEALAAFRAAREAGRPFDLVILDLTIRGGMGGLETMAGLRLIDPGVLAVVSTGYSEEPVAARFQDHGFSACVMKPYDARELSGAVGRLLQEKRRA